MVVILQTIINFDIVVVSVIILGMINHIIELELVLCRWPQISRGVLIENMGAQVNELSLSIKVRVVLDIESVRNWLEVFVAGLYFHFVLLPITHFRKETCLILRASCEGLIGGIAILKSTSFESSEFQEKIASTCRNIHGGVIQWDDIVLVIQVHEPVLVLMIKLTSYAGLLDLSQLIVNFSGVFVIVLAIESIHHLDINVDTAVIHASWLHNDVVLEQALQLLH